MKPSEMGPSAARVSYLEGAYDLLRATLLPEAPERSLVALAYSFPLRGARSVGKRGRIGECHYGAIQGSGKGEKNLIAIHPSEWIDDLRVLAVLAHEMIHAGLGAKVGHKAAFVAVARRIGLEGQPTATTPGLAFKRWINEHRQTLPVFYPGTFSFGDRRVQGTRLRLYECSCKPPFKVRCARDDLYARCEECGGMFLQKTMKTDTRLEGGGPVR